MNETLFDPQLKPIVDFSVKWRFLSNFSYDVAMFEAMEYPTAEHAFNAGKTLNLAERAWVRLATTPGEAKRRGRTLALRDGWDDTVRYEVMDAVVRSKFAFSEPMDLLLSTGQRKLVEGNHWHDQHWGDCHCGRPSCAEPGLNHLGFTLMRVRADLAAYRLSDMLWRPGATR